MPSVSLIDGHIDEPRKTNYDRIRNMSVEEMARNLINFCDLDSVINFCLSKPECEEMIDNDIEIPNSKCCECVKYWLESEVKEE